MALNWCTHTLYFVINVSLSLFLVQIAMTGIRRDSWAQNLSILLLTARQVIIIFKINLVEVLVTLIASIVFGAGLEIV